MTCVIKIAAQCVVTKKCATVHDGVSIKGETWAQWGGLSLPQGTFLSVKCWSVDGKVRNPSVTETYLNN